MYVSLPDRPACHRYLPCKRLTRLFIAALIYPINKYRMKCRFLKVSKAGRREQS
jgi:hypothetical protein